MMNEQTEVVLQSQNQVPRASWPVVFRSVVVAWFAYWFVYAVMTNPISDINWLALLWFDLGVGIMPSLILALGLLYRQIWAYWLAAGSDCTIIAFGLGILVGSSILPVSGNPIESTDWVLNIGMLSIGVVALVAGAHLLKKLPHSALTLSIYSVVATFLASFGWMFGSMMRSGVR